MPIKILNAAYQVADKMPMLRRWHVNKLEIYGDLATSGIFMHPECYWGGNVSIAHCPAFFDHIQIVNNGSYEYAWSRSMKILDEFKKIEPTAPCILTTDECTDDMTTGPVENTKIYNVVNGKSYTNNYGWLWVADGIKEIKRGGPKMVAAIMNLNIKDLVVDGKDISLKQYRTDLALGLHARGLCDIYGKGFDEAVGEMSWRPLSNKWAKCEVKPCPKIQTLSDYKFNLCLENTNWPYFVSEKIWHSIAGGCVPIYTSDTIQEDFGDDKIIDPRDFQSCDQLADFLLGMSKIEYNRRLDGCIDIMLGLLRKDMVHNLCELNVKDFLRDL
jgi:hypothetical protein